jgi:Mg-chelatase subunit ChlD
MLIARETEITSDVFVGVIVDCSGAMHGQTMERARAFGVLIADGAVGLAGIDVRVFGFTERVIYDAGDARRPAVASLEAGGGNNDAAALHYVAQVARASPRRAKLLVMISDGLPTECSVAALKALVVRLTRREGMCCAQVAVRPLEERCFPHYVEVLDDELDVAVRRFGNIVAGLVKKAMAA